MLSLCPLFPCSDCACPLVQKSCILRDICKFLKPSSSYSKTQNCNNTLAAHLINFTLTQAVAQVPLKPVTHARISCVTRGSRFACIFIVAIHCSQECMGNGELQFNRSPYNIGHSQCIQSLPGLLSVLLTVAKNDSYRH